MTPARDQIERNRAMSILLIIVGFLNVFMLACIVTDSGLYYHPDKPIRIGQLVCGIVLLLVGFRDRAALLNRERDDD